jgi:hypothetical protein
MDETTAVSVAGKGCVMGNQPTRVVWSEQPAPGPKLVMEFVAKVPAIPGFRVARSTKADMEDAVAAELAKHGIARELIQWETSPSTDPEL